MKKIAFINQRYGLEVNGGSELYTRLVAERLTKHFDVSVLTTMAIDYTDWANYYKKDRETINGVSVLRFPVNKTRTADFAEFTHYLLADSSRLTHENENKWFDDQGPYSPELIKYIESHQNDYDVFIFVTYLYYPTVRGLKTVASKTVFIPTAHDEPYIHFNTYKKLFHLPKAFVFLTKEEKDFVHQTFDNSHIPYDIMGVGVQIPSNIDQDRVRKKYNIRKEYIIYAGRLDVGKNSDELIRYYQQYASVQGL